MTSDRWVVFADQNGATMRAVQSGLPQLVTTAADLRAIDVRNTLSSGTGVCHLRRSIPFQRMERDGTPQVDKGRTAHVPDPRLIPMALSAVLLGATVTLAASAPPPPSSPPVIRGDGAPSAIPDSYVVKLKDTASVRSQGIDGRARALNDAARCDGRTDARRKAAG